MAQLLVRFARIAQAALGLDRGENLSVGFVQAIVGDAVPQLGVVAIDGNLAANLSLVIEAPFGFP